LLAKWLARLSIGCLSVPFAKRDPIVCQSTIYLSRSSPLTCFPLALTGKGYGMPSSHAQFVSYFAVSITLFLLLRHNPHAPNTSTTHIPTSTFERLALSVLVIAGAAAVAQSRIYLNYHTERQILVGCVVGALFAVFWYLFTTYLRRSGWLDWVLDTSIAKFFRLRDLVVTEDLVDAGWERWQQRRSKRSEQKSR
jgi:dolichyldiphosphatase